MYQSLLLDSSFFDLLLRFDEDLASEVRQGGCVVCGGKLHSARYRRKPRGGPPAGAWIETHRAQPAPGGADVAPRAGAWIETGLRLGLGPRRAVAPAERTFAIVRALAAGVATASDLEIRRAMALLASRMKLVVERGGAAGLAAVLHGKVPGTAGRRVGVVLSGGNVDLERFGALVAGLAE